MDQKKNYKLIYVNGDSFSAGAGLANEFVYSTVDFFKQRFSKSNVWSEAMDRTNIVQNHFRLHIENKGIESFLNLISIEKNRSFAKKIETKSKIKTINNSLGGSSLGEIFHSTVADVQNLLKEYSGEEIFVVLMMTSVTRLCLPDISRSNPLKRSFISVIPGFDLSQYLPIDIQQIGKLFLKNSDDQYLFFNGISSICSLINFLDHLKINYCLLDSVLYEMSLKSLIDVNFKCFNIPVSATIVDWYDDEEKIFLPCGHFTEEVHEKIADYILNNYIKN